MQGSLFEYLQELPSLTDEGAKRRCDRSMRTQQCLPMREGVYEGYTGH